MKKLDLHVLFEKEDDIYAALCLELDVASQGKSLEEARSNIREAVETYIEDVLNAGDEDEFIPRPAPPEEWIKYFEVQSKELKESLRFSLEEGLRVHEAVIG